MKKFALLMIALLVVVAPAFGQEVITRNYDDIDPASLDGIEVDFWHNHSGFRGTQLDAMVAVFNNPAVTLDEFVAAISFEGDEAELETLGAIIDGLREVAAEYNPYGITVNSSNQGGYGEIFEKINLGLVGGGEELPGLVVAYQNQAATYQLDNGLINMTPLVQSDVWGLAEEEQADFFAGFYNADIFSTYDNARLGFPPNRSMEMMYYNIDWLAELEANGAIDFSGAPQTPDQFADAACAATENAFSNAATDADPIGYQLSIDASRFASWTFAFGGDMFDYEANQYAIDSDASIEAMEFLQGLFADGCATLVTERFGDQTSFGAGATLFTVGSSSGLPFYQLAVDGAYGDTDMDGFQWSVAAVPHVTEEPVQNIYGASVSIPATDAETELASWLFMKYYTSAEVQSFWVRASNYFPVRESVAAELDDYFTTNPAYQVAFDLLQYGVTEPPVAGYDFVRTSIEEAMAAIVGDVDSNVAEILTETNTAANEELADLLGS